MRAYLNLARAVVNFLKSTVVYCNFVILQGLQGIVILLESSYYLLKLGFFCLHGSILPLLIILLLITQRRQVIAVKTLLCKFLNKNVIK